jgi:hypothetical protein
MAQAQEQAAEAKQSLLGRVFGSPIAQSLGIFGVAWTLLQGLETFLKFSRAMAYLINHWRELTRGFWSWLLSLVSLDLPVWTSDLLTLCIFILLFTLRVRRLNIDARGYLKMSFATRLWLYEPKSKCLVCF